MPQRYFTLREYPLSNPTPTDVQVMMPRGARPLAFDIIRGIATITASVDPSLVLEPHRFRIVFPGDALDEIANDGNAKNPECGDHYVTGYVGSARFPSGEPVHLFHLGIVPWVRWGVPDAEPDAERERCAATSDGVRCVGPREHSGRHEGYYKSGDMHDWTDAPHADTHSAGANILACGAASPMGEFHCTRVVGHDGRHHDGSVPAGASVAWVR